MTALSRRRDMFPSLFTDFFDSDRFFGNGILDVVPGASVPAVNISENGKAFTVTMAAPGLSKEDFKVSVEDNVLTISSQKEKESKEENEHYTRREFSYSSFSRSFRLPENIRAEAIEASYNDGVLKLLIPKKEEAVKTQAREVKIS